MANLITKHIPNTITCLNLFCGCLAIMSAYENNFQWAAIFIVTGAIFDFFDGMSARVLEAYSPLGKELDSLADMVTFGVAPSMMVYTLLKQLLPDDGSFAAIYLPYMAFVLAAFSALRLAKFNIDERQTSSFIGLPTPANALFWIGICLGMTQTYFFGVWLIVALIILFSYLMISEIPMFSFKFKNLKWNHNKIRYIFLIIAVPMIVGFGFTGISMVIGTYILLSFITHKLYHKGSN